jgi:hypothetical protein
VNYTRYLYDLARELGCGLRMAPNLEGMMFVEFGYVESPDPENSSQYTPQQAFAVGLHELGHFYHGHTQGRPPMGDLTYYFDNGVLQSEAEAWQFALEHFDKRSEQIEDATRVFMAERCIGSYHSAAQNMGARPTRLFNGDRHHVSFTYDVPTPFFYEIRTQLRGQSVD